MSIATAKSMVALASAIVAAETARLNPGPNAPPSQYHATLMYFRPHLRQQAGAVVVEFAMVLLVFLVLAFGVMELARIMYMFNTLQEVTRHAATLAANTDFTDNAAKSVARQAAIFRNSPGPLALGAPITDAHVRIDYLSLIRNGANLTMTEIPTSSLPNCSANNRIGCIKDRNDPACIRFVRVRV